jgi:hypothetical protein
LSKETIKAFYRVGTPLYMAHEVLIIKDMILKVIIGV